MNLRRNIERADRQRAEEARQESKRDNSTPVHQERDPLTEQANGYFNTYLRPIFSEVAAAKGIPMKSRTRFVIGPEPTKGFEISTGKGVTTGELVWNYKHSGGRWSSTTSYTYLSIGITHSGLAVAQFLPKDLSVLDRGGYSILLSSVERVMVENGGQYHSSEWSAEQA